MYKRQTYNSTDLITTKHTKELDYYVKQARISYKISPNILDALEEEPQKVMLISLDQRDKLERFQKKNLNWEKGKCNSFFSSSQYLEYSPKNTSKATGILELTKILNMPMDATVAVGDEDNDVPMIKTACIGVAVKNATEKAKAAADYVTVNDNNHDAIAEDFSAAYTVYSADDHSREVHTFSSEMSDRSAPGYRRYLLLQLSVHPLRNAAGVCQFHSPPQDESLLPTVSFLTVSVSLLTDPPPRPHRSSDRHSA